MGTEREEPEEMVHWGGARVGPWVSCQETSTAGRGGHRAAEICIYLRTFARAYLPGATCPPHSPLWPGLLSPCSGGGTGAPQP